MNTPMGKTPVSDSSLCSRNESRNRARLPGPPFNTRVVPTAQGGVTEVGSFVVVAIRRKNSFGWL
jgi:hypothetical protein